MNSSDIVLGQAVDSLLETLPPVWDRIRSNLRSGAMGKFGISLEQFHTLRHIRRGYCHTGDLAAKRQISRPAISQAVAVLVARGLVRRVQESGDRRLVRLELTPHANEVLDENSRQNRAWTLGAMASLSPEETECVKEAMGILRRAFVATEASPKAMPEA